MKCFFLFPIVCLCLSSFAASPEIEKALEDLNSPDIQVRRDAMDVIAYSEDPRIPYACLSLLKDPGSSIRQLAARAIGSRFQLVKKEDVPAFVKALQELLKNPGDSDWLDKGISFQCQRAIGLLTKDYTFVDVFSKSPDEKWVIYERRSAPVIINTKTSEHKMLDVEVRSFCTIIPASNCKWASDSSMVSITIGWNRRTSAACIYRVSDKKTWTLDADYICSKLNLFADQNQHHPGFIDVDFDRWNNNQAVIRVRNFGCDNDIHRTVTFSPSTEDLRLIE